MPGDRWLRFRDRLLGDPRFHAVSSRVPGLRLVARREAASLFDLCAGFIYSQTLAALISLGLFDLLAGRSLPLAQLATETGLPLRGMEALVEAGAALRLLHRRADGSVCLGQLGAALRGNEGIAAMVRHHAALYADLADPVRVLAEGGARLGAFWPYASGQAGDGAPYTDLMAASQPMVAQAVLAAGPFARTRCLLDVGGGSGRFLEAVARTRPDLGLILFDLPEIAAAARARLDAAGLGKRVRCIGGDFRVDPLPQGADCISLVRVLHDHEDAAACVLLARVRAALPDHGRLVIAEPMADAPRAAAYFSLYLRAMGSGRPRSAREIAAMLRRSGFSRVQHERGGIPLLVQIMHADCKC